MRTFITLIIAVALLVTVVPVMADQAADEAAIRAATKQAIDSDNKRDFKGHAAVYAESFEVIQNTIDLAAHQQVHTDSWASKDYRVKLLEGDGIVFLTPDVAIHKCRVETTGRLDEGGKPLPTLKQAVARVYVKKDGKWVTGAYFFMDIEE